MSDAPHWNPDAFLTLTDDDIRQAIEAEREQCCRDVCGQCEAHANNERGATAAELLGGFWMHPALSEDLWYPVPCDASAIRERAASQEGGDDAQSKAT